MLYLMIKPKALQLCCVGLFFEVALTQRAYEPRCTDMRVSFKFTTRQRSCGKVMFSYVSVGEVPITHDALDLTVKALPLPDIRPHCKGRLSQRHQTWGSPPPTSDLGISLLVISGGDH